MIQVVHADAVANVDVTVMQVFRIGQGHLPTRRVIQATSICRGDAHGEGCGINVDATTKLTVVFCRLRFIFAVLKEPLCHRIGYIGASLCPKVKVWDSIFELRLMPERCQNRLVEEVRPVRIDAVILQRLKL